MVSIITCTIRDSALDNVFQNYDRQTLPDKELIIILNKDNMNINKWKQKARGYKNVTVYQLTEKLTLGECLNFGVKKSRFSFIAKFDDDDYYAPNYLTTMLRPFKYSNVSIVGKTSFYVYFEQLKLLSLHLPNNENKYSKHVAGATLVIKKDVFKYVKFGKMNKGSDQDFQVKCRKKGLKIYSADRFNYVCLRNANKRYHTWKLSDKQLLKYGKKLRYTSNYEPFIKH
ncbi:glycosyltransferase family 2 protein [Alteribacillus sp. YIM 98480]|uniref:glycosyltransferase n=1 Tax=Alteribacillus sp. YIM 98480 TaxID=2606599 RepID=UPI00131EC8EF|nr:glycosyltransferase family A protein [Alteribacillus sp. YIM 98480]